MSLHFEQLLPTAALMEAFVVPRALEENSRTFERKNLARDWETVFFLRFRYVRT